MNTQARSRGNASYLGFKLMGVKECRHRFTIRCRCQWLSVAYYFRKVKLCYTTDDVLNWNHCAWAKIHVADVTRIHRLMMICTMSPRLSLKIQGLRSGKSYSPLFSIGYRHDLYNIVSLHRARTWFTGAVTSVHVRNYGAVTIQALGLKAHGETKLQPKYRNMKAIFHLWK